MPNPEDLLPTPETINGESGAPATLKTRIAKPVSPPEKPSMFFSLIKKMAFLVLLFVFILSILLSLLTLDFLDILVFRHSIPEKYAEKPLIKKYLDFVKLHQLPEEEKYYQLIYEQRMKYNQLITEGSRDLKERADLLESSYRDLIRVQKNKYSNEMENLRKAREEAELEKSKTAALQAELDTQKAKLESAKAALASEAIKIEAALIKFMEKDNRLDQICSIAAQMEPLPLAKIFDEISDDQLIYDILGGLEPAHSAKVLAGMDREKAGKIMRIGAIPQTVPGYEGVAQGQLPQELRQALQNAKDI